VGLPDEDSVYVKAHLVIVSKVSLPPLIAIFVLFV